MSPHSLLLGAPTRIQRPQPRLKHNKRLKGKHIMIVYALNDPSWIVHHTRSARTPFYVARKLEERGFRAFVPTGLRVESVRKSLNSPQCPCSPEVYAPFDNRVFLFVDIHQWDSVLNATFFHSVGATSPETNSDGSWSRVLQSEIDDLAQRQLSREWDHWLARAVRHFEKMIGEDIIIPRGQFKGAPGKIVSLSGAYVR